MKTLVAACATEGTCTYADADAGGAQQLLLRLGCACVVRLHRAAALAPRRVRVTKADGSPCYSFETVLGELTRYTWKDAAGQVVATGSFLGPTRSGGIACADGGETPSCQGALGSDPTAGPCCTISSPGNTTCVSPMSPAGRRLPLNGSMRPLVRISLAAALGMLSLACSSDGNRGAGAGTGGTVGTGGVGGGAGTGGTVGTGGAARAGSAVWPAPVSLAPTRRSLALPGCLKDLLAACAPQGTCVATPADAAGSAFCFASGVRVTLTYRPISTLCNDSSVDVVTVSKPDGTPCYSYETYIDQGLGCEHSTHTWKDAAGNVVATGRRSLVFGNSVGITCMASGERTACEGRDDCCNVSQFGGATCAVGVPPVACTQGSCPGSGCTAGDCP